MQVIENLVYIIGGLALTHSIYGNAKLLRSISLSKPISLIHLLFGSLSIWVIWQHIYQFVHHLKLSPSDNYFLISVSAIISLSLLVTLTYILFPTLIECNMNNERYKKYLVNNRRGFYFVLIVYLLSITFSNLIMETKTPMIVFLSRLIIAGCSLFCLFISFKLNDISSKIDICLRYPVPYFEEKNHILDLNKRIVYRNLIKLKSENNGKKYIDKLYFWLDALSFIICLVLFITIVVIRNFC